jgi:lipopolysaccharide transport system ATP-binding protein
MPAAIRIEGLGKRYRLARGGQRAEYRTLRESLVGAVTAPFRRRAGGTAVAERSKEFWALKDVNFEVQPGEVVGIIGRNGAGKSTLLKVLSRITKPTTGRVEINGRVGSLLEVGTGFHPELSGRENVYLNGSILGMSRTEVARKFDEIVAFAEVEKFLDMPVKRYSSGMYVRLAFAVAAHLEPEVLIVDEVLAVGDAGFQKRCIDRMRETARGGRTVLLVSHQLNTVRDLCATAIWLDKGGVVECGTSGGVVRRYLEKTTQLNELDSWIDLGGSTRVGSAQARFKRVRYHAGVPGRPVSPDGALVVVAEVETFAAATDTRIGVVVTDRFGTRLVDLNSIDTGRPVRLDQGITRVTFSVQSLHLNAGTYHVALAVGSATDLFDSVSEAFTFEVEPDQRDGASDRGLVTRQFGFELDPTPHTADRTGCAPHAERGSYGTREVLEPRRPTALS